MPPLGSPFAYSAPGVDMGSLYGQYQKMAGVGAPGGPFLGAAPQVAQTGMNMTNAMYGTESARNALNYNLGMNSEADKWNRMFNPTLPDILGAGVAGVGALGSIGARLNQQRMYQQMNLDPTGVIANNPWANNPATVPLPGYGAM